MAKNLFHKQELKEEQELKDKRIRENGGQSVARMVATISGDLH